MKIAGVWRSAVQVAAVAAVVALVACNNDRPTGLRSQSTVGIGSPATGLDNGDGNPHWTDDSGCVVDVGAETIVCTIGVAGLGNQDLNGFNGGPPSENAEVDAAFKAIVEEDWTCEHTVITGNDVVKTQEHTHKHLVYAPAKHVLDPAYHNGAVITEFTDDLNTPNHLCPPDNAGEHSTWALLDVSFQSAWALAACVGSRGGYPIALYLLQPSPVIGGDTGLIAENSLNHFNFNC